MESQKFYLLGESAASARTVPFNKHASIEDLKDVIASHFAIVVPEGRTEKSAATNSH